MLEPACYVACGGSSGRRFTDLTASDLGDERDYSISILTNSSSVPCTLRLDCSLLYFPYRHFQTLFLEGRETKKEKEKGGATKKSTITKP